MVLGLALLMPLALFAGGAKEAPKGAAQPAAQAQPFDIAVFVPGVVAGSPLYEQMAEGAGKAVAEYPNASLKVIEAGFNQGEWSEKMTSLAATGEYELIVTSNPAMPFICAEVAKSFPNQKFLNVDAYLAGNPQIATTLYNQVEQAYFVGYLGGLITKSRMPGANPDLKAGMVVAQQYPALDKMMRPGYEQGLKAVDPAITVDFRVIGNWYDANKAADLTNSMIDSGVDVILAIAGGAGQGVIKAAQEKGKYVLFFDSNEYKIAPGTIVGCSILNQTRLVYEKVKQAVEGKLVFGQAEIVHARDGYVDFADQDPLYINNVPEDIRAKMAEVTQKIRSGQLVLEVPQL
jgi:simple sugar transport system substrate-binding protein